MIGFIVLQRQRYFRLCILRCAMVFTGRIAWGVSVLSLLSVCDAFVMREARLVQLSTNNPALSTGQHEFQIGANSAWTGGLARSLGVRGGGGNVKPVATLAELQSILDSCGDVIVCIEFTATWCSPCQQIAPDFEQLSMDLTNVVFVKVDVDENEETAQKYDVNQMPTFLLIRKGEVVDQFSGANIAVLRKKLEGLLASEESGSDAPAADEEDASPGKLETDENASDGSVEAAVEADLEGEGDLEPKEAGDEGYKDHTAKAE